ncbi:unnamed protein product [Prunus armeniaca]
MSIGSIAAIQGVLSNPRPTSILAKTQIRTELKELKKASLSAKGEHWLNWMVLEKTINCHLVVQRHCEMSRRLYHATFTGKELLMLVYVWVAFLLAQIVKLWDSSWYSSTQDKIHSILFVSQKILSRNPWQGKITEEVWIQNSLIIGFDPKSSTSISNCEIMGASVSTVHFNLRLRHLTLDMPLIDYDLAFLFQPMFMLGISIGVAFNVKFADWIVTVLLIILFLGSATNVLTRNLRFHMTFRKQKSSWNWSPNVVKTLKRTSPLLRMVSLQDEQVPISHNIYLKELSMLVYVSVAFLIVHIVKGTHTIALNFVTE